MARREHEGRPAVVLDRTAFYAESGGQPWDTGTLDGVPVVAVVEQGGDVLHVLERALDGRARARPRGRAAAAATTCSSTTASTCSRAPSWRWRAPRPSASTWARTCPAIDLDREVGDEDARRAEARATRWSGRRGPSGQDA